jgi:hypothetical protein
MGRAHEGTRMCRSRPDLRGSCGANRFLAEDWQGIWGILIHLWLVVRTGRAGATATQQDAWEHGLVAVFPCDSNSGWCAEANSYWQHFGQSLSLNRHS